MTEKDERPVVLPFIVGVRWRGQWAQANNLWYDSNLRHWRLDPETNEWISVPGPQQPGEKVVFSEPVQEADNPESLESWINENIGEVAPITAYLRFREEGDWVGVHNDESQNYGLYRDASPVIKSLMSAMREGYIQRATRDPSLLGITWVNRSGKDEGEHPALGQLYEFLDPIYDYGLFVDRLHMGD